MWSLVTIGISKIAEKIFGGSIDRAMKAFTKWRKRHVIQPAPGTKIALLLARLDGDTEHGSHRESVREAIRRELGDAVDIVLWPDALRIEERHGVDAERIAQRTAQNWLVEKRCDLLVWGRVKSSNVVSLRFTVSQMRGPEAQSYELTDTLDLPLEFISDLGVAIAAKVATIGAIAISARGYYLVPLLRRAAERLQPLTERLNTQYDPGTRGSLFHTYALVRDTLGAQSGSPENIEHAIEAYRRTLLEWTRERAPLGWATVHNNLGNAFSTLGGFKKDSSYFLEAITSYRYALEIFTQPNEPLDWANTLSNLGTALQLSGKLDGGTEKLMESVACYHAALSVRTREIVPLDWAMTQNNLGNTLFILSTREESVQRLQESIGAFLEALRERTRERVPFEWAQTASNLAKSLLMFAHLEGNPHRTEAAIDGLKKALEVFEQLGAQRYIVETHGSLIMAEEQLAKQQASVGSNTE
jgi:tetratricopeptide (TPR) repeat protein